MLQSLRKGGVCNTQAAQCDRCPAHMASLQERSSASDRVTQCREPSVMQGAGTHPNFARAASARPLKTDAMSSADAYHSASRMAGVSAGPGAPEGTEGPTGGHTPLAASTCIAHAHELHHVCFAQLRRVWTTMAQLACQAADKSPVVVQLCVQV